MKIQYNDNNINWLINMNITNYTYNNYDYL